MDNASMKQKLSDIRERQKKALAEFEAARAKLHSEYRTKLDAFKAERAAVYAEAKRVKKAAKTMKTEATAAASEIDPDVVARETVVAKLPERSGVEDVEEKDQLTETLEKLAAMQLA